MISAVFFSNFFQMDNIAIGTETPIQRAITTTKMVISEAIK